MSNFKYKKPKCVIFDADGVVINTGEQMSSKYVRKFGVDMKLFDEFFSGVFSDCLTGKADLKAEIMPYLKKWSWNGSLDEFLAWWFDSENCVDNRVIKVIKELKRNNIHVYLATNQEKYRGEYLKAEMGFNDLFDGVFISADIGYKKPEKEFFNKIMATIKQDSGAKPEDILFFDDSKSYIEGAKEVGIEAYIYDNFYQDLLPVLAKYWYNFKLEDWGKQNKDIALSKRNKELYIQDGDVWWCRLGQNIGFEQDGKSKDYSRPVVVIKRLSNYTFLATPLTTASHEHSFRIDVGDFGGKRSKAIISQIRVIDKMRLENRIGRINKIYLEGIRKSIKGML